MEIEFEILLNGDVFFSQTFDEKANEALKDILINADVDEEEIHDFFEDQKKVKNLYGESNWCG